MSFFSTVLWKYIKVFLMSMVPVVELRGAVPMGIEKYNLNVWLCVFVSIMGNLVPVPFIVVFVRRVFAFIRKTFPKLDGIITMFENRAKKKSETVLKYAFWGLFILVAIPLPGTGAWTGALVAAMLDMRLKKAFPSIALGVVAAGIIVLVVDLLIKYGVTAAI